MTNKIKTASVYGEMKNPTLHDIINTFMEYNRKNGIEYGVHSDAPEISAVIVYSKDNWNKEYSEEARSYRIYNDSGKRFFDGMLGNSIYGTSLDGTDVNVRLDCYQWKIERCYFE